MSSIGQRAYGEPPKTLNMTPRNENHAPGNQPEMELGTPRKLGGSVKRSFSFGKKKKRVEKEDEKVQTPVEVNNEVRDVSIDRRHDHSELGFDLHPVTGDVIICHVGAGNADTLKVGDCVLYIQDVPLDGEPQENLDAARHILSSSTATVELTIERDFVRAEFLKRRAALRGTSLDKLGLTLKQDGEHVVVCDTEGLAKKSGRFAAGDRLLSINRTRFVDLQSAVDLLMGFMASEELELELVLSYGYCSPDNHEFDAMSGVFVPKAKPAGLGGAVRRSLSFGKKKKNRNGEGGASSSSAGGMTPRASEAMLSARGLQPLDTDPRVLLIDKNEGGKIQVSFRAHDTTGELIVGLCAEDGPAGQAGCVVGDVVLGIQGIVIDQFGEAAVDEAMNILADTAHLPNVELVVQTRLRMEVLEFALNSDAMDGDEDVTPRKTLGLTFYSFPQDKYVRITQVGGAALASGRIALGDRIVSINGIRVNHAETLSDLIADAAKTSDYVTFEVAHGYAPGEGLWYGTESGIVQMNEQEALEHDKKQRAMMEDVEEAKPKRKPKRSFSFGRKTKH